MHGIQPLYIYKRLIIEQMKRNKIKYVTYGIWQVMIGNGPQKPVTIPTIRVSLGVAIIITATTTRAVATAPAPPMPSATMPSGLYFICRTELLCAKLKQVE